MLTFPFVTCFFFDNRTGRQKRKGEKISPKKLAIITCRKDGANHLPQIKMILRFSSASFFKTKSLYGAIRKQRYRNEKKNHYQQQKQRKTS